MNVFDLRTLLAKRPFKPIRLTISGGKTIDVRHPELCMAGYTSAFIGFPSPEDADTPVFARYILVDMDHIVSAEPVDQQAAQAK